MFKTYTDIKLYKDIKSANEKRNTIAFNHIYQNYYTLASDIIRRRGGNSYWVQEIFQESIIALYEAIKEGRFEQKSSIKTYLYSIIRNKWATTVKRNEQTEKLRLEYAREDDEFYLPDIEVRPQLNTSLKDILDKLEDPCRELLIHYYYDKMSMKEITSVMNYKNEDSTKTQKFKCLQRLIDYVAKKTNIKYILSDLL